MAEVAFEFTGESKSAETALAKLERKYDALEGKIKAVASSSKKGGQESESSLSKLASSVGSAVLQYASIGAAIGALSSAYSAWRDDIDKTVEASTKANRTLIAELAAAGDLASGPKIKATLEGLPIATDEQAQALFSGIRGARPHASVDDVLESVRAAGPSAALFDAPQLKELGAVIGKLSDIAPQRDAGDIVDLAHSVRDTLGEDVGNLLSGGFERTLSLLSQQGVSIEQSLALVATAGNAAVETSTLAKIVDKLDAGKGITLDSLMADPELARETLGQGGATAMKLIDPLEVKRLTDVFTAATAGDQQRVAIEHAIATDAASVSRRLSEDREQDTLRTEQVETRQKEAMAADSKSRSDSLIDRTLGPLVDFFADGASPSIRVGTGFATQERIELEQANTKRMLTEQSRETIEQALGPVNNQPAVGLRAQEPDAVATQRDIAATLKSIDAKTKPAPAPQIKRNAHTEPAGGP